MRMQCRCSAAGIWRENRAETDIPNSLLPCYDNAYDKTGNDIEGFPIFLPRMLSFQRSIFKL